MNSAEYLPGRTNAATAAFSWRSPQLLFVLATGCVFISAVYLRVEGLNGLWYWQWPWQELGLLRTGGFQALALPSLVAALLLIQRPPSARVPAWLVLILLMLSNFVLQLGGLLSHGEGLARLGDVVRSDLATSYFSDAAAIADSLVWLAHFDSANLHLHSLTHPPGPILYYYFWLMGYAPGTAAIAGGLAIGVLATLAIPTLYAFAGLWTQAPRARLLACTLYALLPATIVFLPEFDQVYPILSMAMAIAWVKALRGRYAYTGLLAVAVVVVLFWAYNLLATGIFLILYGVYHLHHKQWRLHAWLQLLSVAFTVLALVVATYLLLWWFTGYDPVHGFLRAIDIQGRLEQELMPRPRLPSLLFDPYNFLLGSGILAIPLLVLGFKTGGARISLQDEARVLSALALGCILFVDLSGLLRGETTRIWLFLQPFVVVPAALQLLRFDRGAQVAIYAMQWVIVVVLTCKISFLDP